MNSDFSQFSKIVNKNSLGSESVLIDSQTCEKQRWVKDGPLDNFCISVYKVLFEFYDSHVIK